MARKSRLSKLQIPSAWLDTLMLIPGYDPVATAGDCRFDADKAQINVDFFHECIHHTKGEKAGQPFVLEPWEKAIVGNLFGWVRPDGTRRYRRVLLYVARKNGKTALECGILCITLFCDGEPGAQVYSAASDRDTAALVYHEMVGVIDQEPQLSSRCRIFRSTKTIEIPSTNSYYKVLTAEARTKHGKNTSAAGIDEVHTLPDGELMHVLETSTSNRRQPLVMYCTTADYDHPSACNDLYNYAKSVLKGAKAGGIDDPYFLPIIYECQTTDNWQDEAVWRKANPNLGVSKSIEYMRENCQRALNEPSFTNEFLRLDLNIRTTQSTVWISEADWAACNQPIDLAALAGRPCWAGLDLSSTMDTSSLVLVFPMGEGRFDFLPYFWVPKDNAETREKRDRVPYSLWAQAGAILRTPGNVIDYRFIRATLNALARKREEFVAWLKRFNPAATDADVEQMLALNRIGQAVKIEEIAYDPYNATQLAIQLQDEDGFHMVEFRQGSLSMNEPAKAFETDIKQRRLRFGAHPVLTWQAGNVSVKTDHAGNILPVKDAKSHRKIDGIIAAIMGLARARRNTVAKAQSVYSKRGVIWI